jgi:PAS domain S-box-containing protein
MTVIPAADFVPCLNLIRAIGHISTVDGVYPAALDALAEGVAFHRAGILVSDREGVMRFAAGRDLSDGFQRAFEGYTPWPAGTVEPEPLMVSDVETEGSLSPWRTAIDAECIAALAFIPLTDAGRVIGTFMLCYDQPRAFTATELTVARMVAAQVGFALARMRAEEDARRAEQRLRFALDAATMGTWEWDLRTQEVRWSDNLARIHGLPDGTFDGTFASYAREIHPDDRERVLGSAMRAVTEGVPHDVEYRLVAPDGTIRWCEGKGLVEYDDAGVPVRMAGVCVIVTRRKEAELQRLEAAQDASRLKDEFLATLSHELRTPLNAIVGWTRMLQGGMVPAERVPAAIDIIGRNAQLQSRLIEDILDVSRIIAGKLDLEKAPIHLRSILESAIQSVAPAAAARGVELALECMDDEPRITGDPRRLGQVFTNLLSNAVRFSEENGRVLVRCGVAGDGIEVEVRDTGAGIAPEFLPFVFDRFRQGDSSTTRMHGGLGLGLAISRYLVEQHGGAITAESAGAGHGATFRVTLQVK